MASNDDDFTPTVGRMRAPGSPKGRKYLNGVIVAAVRAGMNTRLRHKAFAGSRLGRGSAAAQLLGSRDRFAGLRQRRAIVKTRLVRLAGRGAAAARAHLRYIQRDGVSREGHEGTLYSAREDQADGGNFLERCVGDRHQFRLIVSAEDGADYEDLKPLVRRFMARMEEDLGTSLEWVAADHVDTLHPHSHVMIRGKGERGDNLVIAPDYIAHGMRRRLSELVALDLGPRTDLEIERRARLDVDAERVTALDRRFIREFERNNAVDSIGRDMLDHSLRIGRLRKLESLGLSYRDDGGWRLAPGLETALRALGERGDIIRTMQRALTALRLERAPADQVLFDAERSEPVTGRVICRGLADEVRDRHYLMVDGVDGRVHFVGCGAADAVEPLAVGAIVRITATPRGLRDVDRTIAAIAAANDGRYSIEAHLELDAGATPEFASAHVRRLEALRRALKLERDPDGTWSIAGNHLERVAAFEQKAWALRPVSVEILSSHPLERLSRHDGATWLDRELSSDQPVPLRDAGFGREVRSTIAVRRAWLVENGLSEKSGDQVRVSRRAVALLQRRELQRVAAELSQRSGKQYVEATAGSRVEGVVRQRLDLPSGRFALVESSREFSLVPWRSVLGRAVGKSVSGIVRETGISWTIGRGLEI